MRRYLFLILVLICSGLVAFALSLLLFNIESLLLQHLERSLGRKILAGEVQVTFVPAIGLHLKEFAMADDPIFSRRAFLTADDLQVRFKFLPLFLYQLRIKQVILRDPVINVIRNHDGIYNFSSVGLEKTRKTILNRPVNAQAPAKQYAPALIPISLIQVINGTVRYLDHTNGTDMMVSRLDLKVVDLQNKNSFAVELAMAVFAAEQNLQLKAAVGPLLPGELRFDRFDMGKLRAALPVIKKGLPKALDLRGVYSTQGVRFKGTLNRPSLQGQVQGTDASFRFD
jgi:uncharacterized protein involved in outer membrane biogenesis